MAGRRESAAADFRNSAVNIKPPLVDQRPAEALPQRRQHADTQLSGR
jgi:hypothetical protein